jgi:hypothetical protein
MGAVMLAAFDCAVLRWLLVNLPSHGELIFGILPMANFLAGSLVILVRGMWRRGECHAFLVGFVAFGTAAMGLYVAWYALAYGSLVAYVEAALSPLDTQAPQWLLNSAVLVAMTWPQVLLASVGGWLTYRLGIVVARRSSDFQPGETVRL